MMKKNLSQDEVKFIWSQACNELKQELSDASFTTWILTNPLVEMYVDQDNKTHGIISALTAFHATNIRKKLLAQLKKAIEKALDKPIELIVKVNHQVKQEQKIALVEQSILNEEKKYEEIKSNGSTQESTMVSISSPIITTNNEDVSQFNKNIQNKRVKKYQSTQINDHNPNQTDGAIFSSPLSNISNDASNRKLPDPQSFSAVHHKQGGDKTASKTTSGQLFSQSTIQASLSDRAIESSKRIGLRLTSTFETFAVSTSNEMAYAAALAVSKKPGMAYNPLFFYGGVGVGKTHLMHAIAHNILKKNPSTKVIYCTGEQFTNDIITAIQTKKTISFKNKYRKTQVLLIDDIQFLAGKTAVQEEFFHTFNALIQNFSQIILTSDRPPFEISLLENRLRSRFEAGLIIDIGQPSIELRTAIVLIKARERNITIPIDLAQTIAERLNSARRIEGVLVKIQSEVELKNKQLSAILIEEVLGPQKIAPPPSMRVKPNLLIKRVSEFYDLKPILLKGKSRKRNIVSARHTAMYLLKRECNMSFAEVGKCFSFRDHTSVMHAVKKVEKKLQNTSSFQRELNSLKLTILGNN